METPYGGRMEAELPNRNKFNVHLKDKCKIRAGKRWSQCMYMHYILQYLPLQYKDKYSLENSYILALDGDVDFRPKALTDLLQRMRIDENVGAACGRIHPIGSGPVVWFQKFEYAVGHWLQKTAEDVLGCVLCSPGCFSLFRGKDLKESNVARTYERTSSEARQKIQWDQGEDRWLCTLILKRGKRIEYCAASDSKTFAPTDFATFFNQRRRWSPSTVANILDILYNYKAIVKKNDNINKFYIAYQGGLLAASTIAPATVVLVVQSSFQYVFGMGAIGALLLSLIPVVLFVIACYVANPPFQLLFARVLTLVYGLVMMAVLVGVIGQFTESLLNAASLFLFAMIGIYVSAGLLHPNELTCLFHGVIYYILVPSAYIFLPVYSYCNMHIVKWGTRENNVSSSDSDQQKSESKSFSFVWKSLCRCLIYKNQPKSENNFVTKEKRKARENWKKLKEYVKTQSIIKKWKIRDPIQPKKTDITKAEERQELLRVYWTRGDPFLEQKIKKMEEKERVFWKYVIEEHLQPLKVSDADKNKMEGDLKVLRNRTTGAYLFVNSIWIVLTFMLTLVIHDVNITLTDRNGNVTFFNPLAFLFLIFYVIILLIQYLAMLVHRWSTFLQIMSSWELKMCKKKEESEKLESQDGPNEPTTSDNGMTSSGHAEARKQTRKVRKSANEAEDLEMQKIQKFSTSKHLVHDGVENPAYENETQIRSRVRNRNKVGPTNETV